MEVSGRSIIDKAFLMAGITGIGDINSNSGTETEDALLTLNAILDSWKIDKLLQYDTLLVNQSISTGEITIGPSGDITAQRPAKILSAYVKVPGNGNFDCSLNIIEYLAYDSIHLKDLESQIPLYLFYNTGSPDGTIYLWPKPQSAMELYLRYEHQLSEFATVQDVIELTPGYILALQYTLASHLCTQYGLERSDIEARAQKAVATIQRQNVKINTLMLDRRMPRGNRGFGGYNINSGLYT